MIGDRFDDLTRFDAFRFRLGGVDTVTRDQLVAHLYEAAALVESCDFPADMPDIERRGYVLDSLLRSVALHNHLPPRPGREAIRIGRGLAHIHGVKPKAVAA